jgi:spermidine synthase
VVLSLSSSSSATTTRSISLSLSLSCPQIVCRLHLKIIKHVTDVCKRLFNSVSYAYTTIPTYPSGSIGFVISSKREGAKLSQPSKSVKKALGKKKAKTLRYYTGDVHRTAFVLPRFVELELDK